MDDVLIQQTYHLVYREHMGFPGYPNDRVHIWYTYEPVGEIIDGNSFTYQMDDYWRIEGRIYLRSSYRFRIDSAEENIVIFHQRQQDGSIAHGGYITRTYDRSWLNGRYKQVQLTETQFNDFDEDGSCVGVTHEVGSLTNAIIANADWTRCTPTTENVEFSHTIVKLEDTYFFNKYNLQVDDGSE